LTNLNKEELLNNLKIATKKWDYFHLSRDYFHLSIKKKMENKLVLINSYTPSFSSKHLAAKELNISTKTISKFLNIHKDYKGLYFYSIKV